MSLYNGTNLYISIYSPLSYCTKLWPSKWSGENKETKRKEVKVIKFSDLLKTTNVDIKEWRHFWQIIAVDKASTRCNNLELLICAAKSLVIWTAGYCGTNII